MPDVIVDRLRMHAPPRCGPRPDPRASARALDLALPLPDRQVLIVRRLAVAGGDRVAARARLETLQRQAVRPADGPVDPHAEAVVFADEAEALCCLTRDVVNGRTARWYWAGRLPAHAASTGEVLCWLWAERPRWVPAVLSRLARDEPAVAARALRSLPPGAGELIASAVAREYGVPAPAPGFGAPRRGVPGDGNATSAAESLTLSGAGAAKESPRRRAPSPGTRAPALTPPPSQPGAEASERSLPAAARRLLELAVALVPGPTPLLLATGDPAEASPVAAEADSWSARRPADPKPGRPPDRPTTAPPPPAGIRPAEGAEADTSHVADRAALVTVDDDPRREVFTQAGPEADPAARQDGGIPAWAAAATATRSCVASAAYAITLMQRTGAFPAAAARGQTGWAAVEGSVRWLLAGLPGQQRQAALRDPLLSVLAELDGRRPRSPQPAPPDRATRRRMLALLTSHHVPRTAFAITGTVHVSRTHVDVVLPINGIDLAVRTAGLDQDPGWVPGLGRVVLVHFEGGG